MRVGDTTPGKRVTDPPVIVGTGGGTTAVTRSWVECIPGGDEVEAGVGFWGEIGVRPGVEGCAVRAGDTAGELAIDPPTIVGPGGGIVVGTGFWGDCIPGGGAVGVGNCCPDMTGMSPVDVRFD